MSKLQMSDLDEAFAAGRDARRTGKKQESNPHSKGTRLYNPWRAGWQAERKENG